MKRTVLAVLTVTLLAGCQADRGDGQGGEDQSGLIPNIGFDAQVSNAAVDAYRNALSAQTNGSADVVASEFSQANSTVYMVVGAQRAPWRCLVANDGTGPDLMFMGRE